jgi:hypothetical protein
VLFEGAKERDFAALHVGGVDGVDAIERVLDGDVPIEVREKPIA